MKKLLETLKNLNNFDHQTFVWVCPSEKKVEDWDTRIIINSEKLSSDWCCIGDAESLSFGYQFFPDAIRFVLENYKFKNKIINAKASQTILDAYERNKLENEFHVWLEESVEEVMDSWSKNDCDNFINNKLPDIIKEWKERNNLI